MAGRCTKPLRGGIPPVSQPIGGSSDSPGLRASAEPRRLGGLSATAFGTVGLRVLRRYGAHTAASYNSLPTEGDPVLHDRETSARPSVRSFIVLRRRECSAQNMVTSL